MTTLPASFLGIHQLKKYFGKNLAINEVTLNIRRGQIVCLLGPSGCGKTTMLRMIAGLESPDDGCIKLDQQILWNPLRQIEAENRNIGLVFQDYALFPHLTVLENIKFGLTGYPKRDRQDLAENALNHVSLLKHADKYPHMLSGGEQQRVALARALAPKPSILLMDEPFSNLDQHLRKQIRQSTLEIVRQTGTTTLIVTHEPSEALQIADQIILMHQGRVIQVGTPQQLYESPNCCFAAEYFSTLNKIPCRLKDGVLHSECGHLRFNLKPTMPPSRSVTGDRYLYCFRPYDVGLSLQAVENSIPVQVRHIAYLGHQLSIQVLFNHTEHIFDLQGTHDFSISPGQQLFMQIDVHKSLIFPDF